MGQTIEINDNDKIAARNAVYMIMDRTKGDDKKFIDEVVDFLSGKIAEARIAQNALHERDFGDRLTPK